MPNGVTEMSRPATGYVPNGNRQPATCAAATGYLSDGIEDAGSRSVSDLYQPT